MSSDTLIEFPILSIEAAPGDPLRAVEQANGDLLLPAATRPVLEDALLMAQLALPPELRAEHSAITEARRLLGIEQPDTAKQSLALNLLKVRPI